MNTTSDRKSLVELKQLYKNNDKRKLNHYYWQNFEEKLDKLHSKIALVIMSSLLAALMIFSLVGSIISGLNYWLVFVLPGIGASIAIVPLKLWNRKRSMLNDFNFKRSFFIALIILMILLISWTWIARLIWGVGYFSIGLRFVVDTINWFNLGLTALVIAYTSVHRIIGAGEFEIGLVKLLTDIESVPENDKKIVKNLNAMLKGLDDWCFEKLNSRIENLENYRRDWLTVILLDFPKFQENMKKVCTEELLLQLWKDDAKKQYGWNNIATLSWVLNELKNTFKNKEADLNFDTRFYIESLRKSVTRNLGKIGIFSTVFSAIGGLISVIPMIL